MMSEFCEIEIACKKRKQENADEVAGDNTCETADDGEMDDEEIAVGSLAI